MAYYVYVVELARRPGHSPPGRAELYVGSSAFTPEDRFIKHKMGGPATSRFVRRFGVRLRPELYAHLRGPIPERAQAWAAEKALKRSLEARGFVVHGACTPNERGCFF